VYPRAGVELWERTENFFPFLESAVHSAVALLLLDVEMDVFPQTSLRRGVRGWLLM
jgi:hypothetical protein